MEKTVKNVEKINEEACIRKPKVFESKDKGLQKVLGGYVLDGTYFSMCFFNDYTTIKFEAPMNFSYKLTNFIDRST